MKLDTPLAQLRYFLQDELYLLKGDMQSYRNPDAPQTATVEPAFAAADMEADTTTASASPTTSAIIEQTYAPTFKYLGNNQKSFLILTHYPAEQFIAEAHLTALLNTVTRLNFSQDDVAIVNLSANPAVSWPQLADFFNPAKLLVLGAAALPAQMPNLNQNEVQQLNACLALYTFSFDEMMGNKENTKAFWNQIKTF
ncbi:hypothetical protein ACFQ3S_09850 [Mucilaginibacter terrae]